MSPSALAEKNTPTDTFMRKIFTLALALNIMLPLKAQTGLGVSDLHQPSLISPYYFGPNAFPVPDMVELPSAKARIEIGTDLFLGLYKDRTSDAYFRLNLPLFTPRVNLSIWMPVMEWYSGSLERQRICRLPDDKVQRGRENGDVYVSTDILVLDAGHCWVDMTVRAALKSASANGFASARAYDAPAYFFDATLSRGFQTGAKSALRLAASAGFLCWQTDNGRQNDAVMYGVAATFRAGCFHIRESFGGYSGWEQAAARDKNVYAGDRPMTVKSEAGWSFGAFELILSHQYGLRDWPFSQFRLGLAYSLPAGNCR